jgi:16S rRNA (adenine1518-N6/adenine1519-N6)-dimethyltransferase
VSARRSRAALAQNLLVSDAPACALVRAAEVRPGERVYDLGAGTGRITSQLVAAGAGVIAVERTWRASSGGASPGPMSA